MKIGSWNLCMRIGKMGYIQFNLVYDKGAQRGSEALLPIVKSHILPILMKFKPHKLGTK